MFVMIVFGCDSNLDQRFGHTFAESIQLGNYTGLNSQEQSLFLKRPSKLSNFTMRFCHDLVKTSRGLCNLQTEDVCECLSSHSFPHGRRRTIFTQWFLLLATLCNGLTLLSCRLAHVDADIVDEWYTANVGEVPNHVHERDYRGLGLKHFQGMDGACTCDLMGTPQQELYYDFVGRPWKALSQTGTAHFVLGVVCLVWIFGWSCVSHVRVIRRCLAVFLVVLGGVQASMLSVFGSPFCQEHKCTPCFTAGMCGLGALCYCMAAAFTWSMRDCTPELAQRKRRKATLTLKMAGPADGVGDAQEIPVDHIDTALVSMERV